MNKRGLSQVVTTLLFVLLALGAVLLVWNLVRGIIGDAESEIDITQFSLSLSIPGKNVLVNPTLESVSLVVKRNAGTGEIKGVNIILTDSSGQSSVFRRDIVINELESKRIDVSYFGSGLGEINKVSVAPILDRNGEEAVGSVAAEFDVQDVPVGGALDVDGIGQYVKSDASSPHIAEIAGDKLTLSAWINLDELIGEQHIMIKNGPFQLQTFGDKLEGWIYNGIWTNVQGIIPLTANEWHHVSMVYDGVAMKLYVDGVFDKSVSKSGNLAGGGCFNIGRVNDGTCDVGAAQYFDGTIDDVRVYNTALTDSEIDKLYNNGVGDINGEVSNGLVLWYKFDEGSGTTAFDSSGDNDALDVSATWV